MNDVSFKEILESVSEGIPKYRRIIFKVLIAGLVIGESSKCVSSIYRMFAFLMFSMGISRRRFYDFLQSGKLPFERVWKILLKMFDDSLLTDGRIIALLDDTTYGKTGRKIEGCDTHYDHAHKINSAKYIHGQCRVVLGLLVNIHNRWACLPIKNALQRIEKSVSKELFRTKIQLGGKLIRELMEEFSCNILVVADSWFGNKSMAKEIGLNFCEKVHILTRLRIDCLLYEIHVEQNKGRGRKRKYGKKLPKLKELAKTLEHRTDEFVVYGKTRKVEYSELTAMHKGFMRQVRVVLVYTRKGHIFPILSTDLNLSVKEMIEYYSARWKIESGFKELKQEIGAIDNQARRIRSVENHFTLCSMAQSIVWLYALNQQKAPARRYASAKSTSYSFGDVRRMVASEYYEKGIFTGTCSKTIKSLENIFMLLFLSRSAQKIKFKKGKLQTINKQGETMNRNKILGIIMAAVIISGAFNLIADSVKPRVAEIASWDKFIVVLHVKLGDRVKEGQLLFENNLDLLNIEKEFNEENVKFNKLCVERGEDLYKKNAISEDIYLNILSDMTVAENDLKLTEAKIALSKYYAPFDGTVTHIEAYDGSAFGDSDMFMIVTEGDVKVDTKNRTAFVSNRWEGSKVITHVALGEKVKKGQLLFNLDLTAFDAQKAIYQSRYDYLKKVYERNRKLVETNSVSLYVHYKSYIDYMKAKRELETINVKIKQSYQYAPFDAEITSVIRYTGSGIGDGKPALTIRALE